MRQKWQILKFRFSPTEMNNIKVFTNDTTYKVGSVITDKLRLAIYSVKTSFVEFGPNVGNIFTSGYVDKYLHAIIK